MRLARSALRALDPSPTSRSSDQRTIVSRRRRRPLPPTAQPSPPRTNATAPPHQVHPSVDRERRSRKYGPVAPAPTPSSLTIGRMPVVSSFTSKQNESNVWIFYFRGESSTSIPTMSHRRRRLLCPRTRAATQSPESHPRSHPSKFPKIFSATKPRSVVRYFIAQNRHFLLHFAPAA